LLLTVALTVTLADAVAADASEVFNAASTPVATLTAATVRTIRLILIPSFLFRRALWSVNELCGRIEQGKGQAAEVRARWRRTNVRRTGERRSSRNCTNRARTS
jgi:hypothetical protein